MTKKTDNHNIEAKLALRRKFIAAYHSDGRGRVLDCCQGGGNIWDKLRSEFCLASYIGFDVKRKKGRLSLKSERFLDQPGWSENIIDIDTYGSPWKHWFALVDHCDHNVTVFLTIGQWQMGTDSLLLCALNLQRLPVPPGIAVRLHGIGTSACIGSALCSGFLIKDAAEADNKSGSARYIAIRLEK